MAADGERVGGIYYEITADTAGLIDGQRKAEAALKKAGDAGDVLQTRLTKTAAAVGAALADIGAEQAASKLKKAADAAADTGKSFTDAGARIGAAGKQAEQAGQDAAQGAKALSDAAAKAAGGAKDAGDAAQKAGEGIKKAGEAADAAGTTLRDAGAAAGAASEQVKKVGDDGTKAGDGLKAAGDAAENAAKSVASAGDAADKAAGNIKTAGGSAGAAADHLSKTQEAAASAAKGLDDVGEAARKGLGGAGKSADKLAHDMRQVAPQITDVVTQLASGADPLLILIQQGGQLKDMFGGVKEAAIAVGRYIASLVTPFGVAATAAALIGYALHKAAEESEAFEKAIALTGGAAGITEGQFNSLAASISDATGTTIGSAREALQKLVADGKLSGDALTSAATGVERMAKATGGDVTALAGKFSEAMRDPVSWALRMNEQVRFLTPELYRQMKALADVGETSKAATLAFDALNAKLSDTKRDVGAVEAAWNSLKRAASDGINFVLSWGRNGTPDDALAKAEADLARLKGPAPFQGASGAVDAVRNSLDGGETLKRQIADQELLVASLRATKKLSEDVAAATGARTQREQDGVKWAQMAEASLTAQARMAKEIAAANALADKTGASPRERAAVLASIRERYAGIAGEEQALSQARAAAAIAGAQRVEQATAAGIQRAGELLEAQHAAGLASDAAYYDARRRLAEQDGANQVAAIDREMQVIAAQQLSAKNGADMARLEEERSQKLADLAAKRAQAAAATQQRLAMLDMQEQQRARELEERNARARAAAQIAETQNTERQITMIRDEAIRQAEEAYRRGQATFEEAEAAKTRAIMDAMAQQKALRDQRQQTQVQTLQIRAQATGNPVDQEAAIRGQGQLQIDALNQKAQGDLENWQTYADQKVAITQQMEQQIQDVQAASTLAQIAMAQSAAGQMLGVLQKAGKERTAMGKALFLAERALAVATIIMNTEMGAQKAVGMAGPFGIPMATMIRATGYASAGMVAGLALADAFGGGRQYGGPVSADTLYRVNETGRPEMYTASNGAQYMLPTSGGRITPADQVGGGNSAPTINIFNNGRPMEVASSSWNSQRRTMDITVREVAEQIAERRGPVWGALRTTNVQGRAG